MGYAPPGGGGGGVLQQGALSLGLVLLLGTKRKVESSADSQAVRSFLHIIRTEKCLKFPVFSLFRVIGNCFVMSRNWTHLVFYSMGTGVV